MCNLCNISLNETFFSIVKWIRSSALFVKLNSDSSCIRGKCGAGGVVRDNNGKFIIACAIPLGQGTSNWAEACAMLFGINWFIQKGTPLIIGETYSILIHSCISGTWATLWRISDKINELKMLEDSHDIVTHHCFREANKVADKLAALCHINEEACIYTNFNSLPRQVKGLLNADRWHMPTFRVKRRKPSGLIYEPP
ncbi:PREDICTED: uncharacterized protein LOC109228743 [Nicotiana attenuata]|uniref:RNase H type-1 domain-containing protein n=1 Tax=Nicotiana attenuata TaxID=49451 RepID=A0A1J6I575_NICAT|nr:PREDICTED: uncharacterized protein LOC109228743 [Nicotiana attenuata]OIT00190.1 hypothetical protein A4A49_02817 [Nicotiana attenuata]